MPAEKSLPDCMPAADLFRCQIERHFSGRTVTSWCSVDKIRSDLIFSPKIKRTSFFRAHPKITLFWPWCPIRVKAKASPPDRNASRTQQLNCNVEEHCSAWTKSSPLRELTYTLLKRLHVVAAHTASWS